MCSRQTLQYYTENKMSHIMRKQTGPYKPVCVVTEDGKRLESLDLESRGTVLSV